MPTIPLPRAFSAIASVTISLAIVGCFGGITSQLEQTNVELRNAVDEFDRAIDALTMESADWQITLQNLQQAIVADVQSTIRVELTNLARETVLGAGSEFRCDVEFLQKRTARELVRIRNELAQLLNESGIHPTIPLLPETPRQPVFCSAVPIVVDTSLATERRTVLVVHGFDLLSASIDARVIPAVGASRNVTSALGIVSDYQLALDLSSSGADIVAGDRRIVFGWRSAPRSVVRVVTPGTPGPTCTITTRKIPGNPQSFIPPKVNGDSEFGGNGPCVSFDLDLYLTPTGRKLNATYEMKARECAEDHGWAGDKSEAHGSATKTLLEVPSGEQILSFDVADHEEWDYRDTDHSDDVYTFAGNSPIEKLIFTGDTDGHEVGTKTKVEIYFADIEVEIEKCTTTEGP